MDSENQLTANPIKPESPEKPVTVNLWPREVDMYCIMGSEIETLGTPSVQFSLHLGLFGVAFGAALTLVVTLKTVTLTSFPITYAVFFVGAIAAIILMLYFGIRSAIYWRESQNQIKSIKQAIVTREIKPT